MSTTFPRVPFFESPSKGRRVMAGFSYLQRIGKGARTRSWFPEPFLHEGVEWAAVREFELLQEADNLVIDDLEVTEMELSFGALQRMRGGGYRFTMVLLGNYAQGSERDDLQILDEKMQEEITHLIHFLYLGEQSEQICATIDRSLSQGTWSCADALPHIAQAIGERKLFKPHKEVAEETAFFEILQRLPAKHIMHDVAVGLALPDATKEKNWVYLAMDEHKVAAFFGAIGATMGEVITHHMRGYGDRLTPKAKAWQQSAARAVA